MVEPVTVVAVAGAFGLGRVGLKLLERIFGPLSDELGIMAASPMHQANLRRGRVIEKAAEHLQAAGVEPGTVSLKILLPIIERSGYEEDSNLAERWAALLANAAHPTRSSLVLPIFPHILSLLSPEDAVLLEMIDKLERKNASEGKFDGSRAWVDKHNLPLFAGIPHDRAEIALSSLIGHNLIEQRPSMDTIDEKDSTHGFIVPVIDRGVAVTPLGRGFLRACRFPEPNTAGSGEPLNSAD